MHVNTTALNFNKKVIYSEHPTNKTESHNEYYQKLSSLEDIKMNEGFSRVRMSDSNQRVR